MAIRFTCPECGRRYRAADEAAGRVIRCAACKAELKVQPDGPPPVPVVVAPPVAAGRPSRKRLIVIVAAIALLVLAATVSYLAWPRTRARQALAVTRNEAKTGPPAKGTVATKPSPPLPPAGVAQPKKVAAEEPVFEDPHPSLGLGDEATIRPNGDETVGRWELAKSGIVTADSLVLTFPWRGYAQPGMPDQMVLQHAYNSAYIPIVNAIKAADPDGVDMVIARGGAVRVRVGTRVRVVDIHGNGSSGLPLDDGKVWNIRIIEGEHKGKVVAIPPRNLKPIPKKRAAQ